MRFIWVFSLLVLLLLGCDAVKEKLYPPRIRVKCEAMRGVCAFENYGDPGDACVVVEVFHHKSGTVLKSNPVCSGRLERGTPSIEKITWPDTDPLTLCMGEDMKGNFALTCEVSVVEGK